MSERHDLPKIKPVQKPSIFNHEAGKWGEITAIVATFVALPLFFGEAALKWAKGSSEQLEKSLLKNASKTGIAITGIAFAAATMGGLKEKSKQEHEQVEGRTVKTPGYWNKGILSGSYVTGLVTLPLRMAGVLRGAPTVLVTLAGAAVGSAMRNSQLERDYTQAIGLQQHDQQKTHQMLMEQEQLIQKLVAKQAASSVDASTVTSAGTLSASPSQEHIL